MSWLAEHYLLSTDQIHRALFIALRTAQMRLTILHRLQVLHRFAFSTARGAPESSYLYTLGPVGLRRHPTAYADPDNARLKAPRSSIERADRIARSPTLPHLLGVNQFFIDLHAHTRAHPDTRLLRWWSEQHATAAFSRAKIFPDGHGIWAAGTCTVGFFLEHDRGTEFSGGRRPCRPPDLRVSAAQRLMRGRYRPRQVWRKRTGGVSPVRVLGAGWSAVHSGQYGGVGRAGHGSSASAAWARPRDRGDLSRDLGCRASECAAFPAWCPCRDSAWGRCGGRYRDRHPNRPPCAPLIAAQGRFAGVTVLLRKPFRGLSCGGGKYA
jgi:hypothetical protein